MEVQFPHANEEEIPQYIERMQTTFASLQGFILSNTDKISFEIYKKDSYITLHIGSNNQSVLERTASSLTQIPNVVIKKGKENTLEKTSDLYCKTVTNVKDFYPITQDIHFFDNLLTLLNNLPDEDMVGLQFILRGVNKNEEMQRRRRNLENKAVKAQRRQTDRETYLFYLYQKKQEGNLFKVKINIVSNKRGYLSNLASQLRILNFEENIFYMRGETRRNIKTRFISPDTYFSNIHLRRKHEGTYINNRELAYLIHPSSAKLGSYSAKQTNDIEAKPEFLTDQEDNILIGTTQDQKGIITNLYFPIKNFVRHIYAIGKTGSGKSSLLVALLKTLMQKSGTTVFVFDPHGDLLTDILRTIKHPEGFVYLNVNNASRVFTINPLFAFRKSTNQKAVIKDKLLDIIRNETEELSGGATTGNATYNRMRQVLDIGLEFPDAYYAYLIKKGKIKERAEQLVHERQLTLNDLPFLLEKNYDYASILEKIFNDNTTEAGQYIKKLMPDHMRQPAVNEAMQVRMSQLLHASTRLVYEGNALTIDSIMDSGKTFLFPIPESVFGSRGSRGLLQIIFSLLWINKQEVEKKEQRKNTYVVIDEFQNAQLEDIPKILSEARKYRLYLIASNQYLGQLKEKVQHALFGNVGTLISFNVGAGKNGAKTMAENFGDAVTERDLTMLPSYHAYLKTKVPDKDEPVVFSFTTIPVEEKEASETIINKINAASLREYGELKSELEAKLAKKQDSPSQYFLEGI